MCLLAAYHSCELFIGTLKKCAIEKHNEKCIKSIKSNNKFQQLNC